MLYREIMENEVMWGRKAKKEKLENPDHQGNRQNMFFQALLWLYTLNWV